MAFIIFLIFSTASAFLYGFVFRNRLTYLTMDNNVMAESKRTRIFRAQVFGSVILSIIIVKMILSYFPSNDEEAGLHFIILLTISYVIVLLLSGYAIDVVLRLTTPKIRLYSALVENPDLLTEVEDLKTDALMKRKISGVC